MIMVGQPINLLNCGPRTKRIVCGPAQTLSATD
jgi:hypothetical protein